MKIAFKTLQSHTNYIAMVQARIKSPIGEFQPKIMKARHILRPKARRVRTQIDKELFLVGGEYLERKRVARFRKFFPCQAKTAGQLGRFHAQRRTGNHLRHLQLLRGFHNGIQRIGTGDHQQFHCLALFLRQGHDFGKQRAFVVTEKLVLFQWTGGVGDLPNRHHHNVVPAHVGLGHHVLQVRQVTDFPDRHQDGAGARMNTGRHHFGLGNQVELLQTLFLGLLLAAVDPFRHGKDQEQNGGKQNAVNGGEFLREEVNDGGGAQHGGGEYETHGNLHAGDLKVEGHPVFLIGTLEAKHQHTNGVEEETPDHAECVGFTQHVFVAAAQRNGDDLQHGDDVDDAVRGAEFIVRMAEPVHQNTVFGDAVHNAVGADDGGVYGARQYQNTYHHDKHVEAEAQDFRARQMHREAA